MINNHVHLQALKERDPKRATAEGESIRALAEGEAAAKKLQADADLYVRMKEAEGELGALCVQPHYSTLTWELQGGAASSCQLFRRRKGRMKDWMACIWLKFVLPFRDCVLEPSVVHCQGVQCPVLWPAPKFGSQHMDNFQLRDVLSSAGARALVQAQAAGLQAIMQACGGEADLAKFW